MPNQIKNIVVFKIGCIYNVDIIDNVDNLDDDVDNVDNVGNVDNHPHKYMLK